MVVSLENLIGRFVGCMAASVNHICIRPIMILTGYFTIYEHKCTRIIALISYIAGFSHFLHGFGAVLHDRTLVQGGMLWLSRLGITGSKPRTQFPLHVFRLCPMQSRSGSMILLRHKVWRYVVSLSRVGQPSFDLALANDWG